MTVCWLLSSSNPRLLLTPSESCHLEKPHSTPKNLKAGNFLYLPWQGALDSILSPDPMCVCVFLCWHVYLSVCGHAGLLQVCLCVGASCAAICYFVCVCMGVLQRHKKRQMHILTLTTPPCHLRTDSSRFVRVQSSFISSGCSTGTLWLLSIPPEYPCSAWQFEFISHAQRPIKMTSKVNEEGRVSPISVLQQTTHYQYGSSLAREQNLMEHVSWRPAAPSFHSQQIDAWWIETAVQTPAWTHHLFLCHPAH